ncbi:hypothetical protein [Pelomonas sp. KK5]|uniref:hypothetical protein n=1 Tax=Pelomonas sp. KK5 TaxID=1855730 RepID=UPI00097C18EC|nr:hypothetical protein [Pelomonas sp. KK5]
MSSSSPASNIILGINDGRSVVLLPDGSAFAELAPLLAAVPSLLEPAQAGQLALAVNQLAHGIEYEVILDPAAYEAASRARLAAEDPNEPWREGVERLGDYGVPDFAAIVPPRRIGEGLRFYAADRLSGVPYQVDLAALDRAPAYDPLRLTPLPRTPAASGPRTQPDSGDDDATETVPRDPG